ncbi:hypothetical protein [Iningainema tapete]|uniref:Uncharacterized protein n=1 Tax=Iningainema tapete BLCC-T55 TaxID=2748662 RepID=A0A8J7BWM9_9CYAN|nr:hypothetical protein [Iningainema tapete]MBD2772127.1 hypothetical protein [Iningainema tapete BLCC-T55]
MRILFEFGENDQDTDAGGFVDSDSTDLTSSDDVHTPARDFDSASWKYALCTALLAVSIVVHPISEWIDAQPVVQQVRILVNPQVSQAPNSLAVRIYQAMQRFSYKVSQNEGEVNIIYIRGANQLGKPNGNRINDWSDRRLLLMFRGGQPVIVGNWAATVKPGLPAIRNPLGKAGAAFIEPGQYSAWRVGTHHGIFGRVEEGLVQVAPVKFRRDVNRDGDVNGELIQSGMIGLNQHSGSNQSKVNKASYACLAAQSENGHHQFMSVVKADPRYRAQPNYVFNTTILDVSDL